MKHVFGLWLVAALTGPALAGTDNFDTSSPGGPPTGWTCGVTAGGAPKWTVETDATAPSQPNVLRQSGFGEFPWCVRKEMSLADGFVEVRFKPLQGHEDMAGGVVWRWAHAGRYYVARANALENNLSLYWVGGGRRNTIKYVNAPVPRDTWHLLRVEFTGRTIRVLLDGKPYIEMEDEHIAEPGAVGVWTKADSVTMFDDFAFGDRK